MHIHNENRKGTMKWHSRHPTNQIASHRNYMCVHIMEKKKYLYVYIHKCFITISLIIARKGLIGFNSHKCKFQPLPQFRSVLFFSICCRSFVCTCFAFILGYEGRTHTCKNYVVTSIVFPVHFTADRLRTKRTESFTLWVLFFFSFSN